jgi:alpha-galactosidase
MQPSAKQLLVLGNSITYHAQDLSLGWNGDWGMAASAEDKDFAHLTAIALGLPLTRFNIATLETTPDQAKAVISTVTPYINSTTDVIVELGDNVTPTSTAIASFQTAYHQLLSSALHSRSITCTSTFWHNVNVDTVIQQECSAAGGQYVYLGDISDDPANTDMADNTFTDPAVAQHPQDWGMKEISRRLLFATIATTN